MSQEAVTGNNFSPETTFKLDLPEGFREWHNPEKLFIGPREASDEGRGLFQHQIADLALLRAMKGENETYVAIHGRLVENVDHAAKSGWLRLYRDYPELDSASRAARFVEDELALHAGHEADLLAELENYRYATREDNFRPVTVGDTKLTTSPDAQPEIPAISEEDHHLNERFARVIARRAVSAMVRTLELFGATPRSAEVAVQPSEDAAQKKIPA